MRRLVIGLLFTGLIVLVLSIHAMPVQAVTGLQTDQSTPTPVGGSENPHEDPTNCLGCHANQKMAGQFVNGDIVPIYFDPNTHPESSHTQRCAACHEDQKTYPHVGTEQSSCATCHWEKNGLTEEPEQFLFELPYDDERELSLSISDSCEKCHAENYSEMADSVHLKIMADGNRFAPVCVDCHSSHDIVPDSLTRESVPVVCSECHLSVYTSYQSSVHGTALKNDANPDVPNCEDCHGVHNVNGPRDANFEFDAVQTCGNCHSDAERMGKYGISTDVLQTYLDDVHGRAADGSTNSDATTDLAASCFDCHGVHNIRAVDDPLSTIYPENLQLTCQQCHEDASIRFPQAWLGHNVSTLETAPLLYFVNQIYKVLIPVTLGLIIVYILLDAVRRFLQHRRGNSNGTK